VTVKSLAGGSYAGTQNPTGAVAKANQNAATQAPTVIIQATSAANSQMIPLLGITSTPPSCPVGYHSVWSASSTSSGCTFPPVFNIAGSRFSFTVMQNSGAATAIGFLLDGNPAFPQGFYSPYANKWTGLPVTMLQVCSSSPSDPWSATLCSQ